VVLATQKKQQQKTLIQKTNKEITRNKTRRKKNAKSYQIENKQTKKATGSMHTHETLSSTRMYKAMKCIVYYLQQKQKQDSYIQFLDIYLEIDINGYLSIRLYDKGDHLKDWSLSYVALELAV
jgi:Cdc6-like AAA superfamily ATPase